MKNQEITKKVTLKQYEYLNNSYYGNPKVLIIVECTDNKETLILRTATNSACAYMICSSLIGKDLVIKYHYTSKGLKIVTKIERA